MTQGQVTTEEEGKRGNTRAGAWRVMLREYGEGYAEGSFSFVSEARRAGGGDLPQVPDGCGGWVTHLGDAVRHYGERLRRDRENGERSVRRSRTTVRHKVMSMAADHLLTLTFKDNVTEEREAFGYLQRFLRAWRDAARGPVSFVYVPERQARGGLHYHLAVRGWQDVRLLRRLWVGVLGGKGKGNVDVKGARGPRAVTGRERLARYLSKYIGKGFEACEWRNRYGCSRNITVPGFVLWTRECPRAGLECWLAARAGGEVRAWLDDGWKAWGATWNLRGRREAVHRVPWGDGAGPAKRPAPGFRPAASCGQA